MRFKFKDVEMDEKTLEDALKTIGYSGNTKETVKRCKQFFMDYPDGKYFVNNREIKLIKV